ncbi:MAG TPA: penicillin-binding protein 2 [Candidatus Methylacidiphilales bacterium]|nr:penicillin-binding protein 2 [Candidatus Methylacidiphilales bacterium]
MQHRTRALWIVVLLSMGYTVISFNLIQIQLVEHAKFWRMAIENHLRPEMIPSKRGAIFDCEGNILAQTHLVYDVRLDGRKLAHPEVNLPRLEEALLAPAGSIAAVFDERNRYQLIAQNVEDATVARLRELNLNCLIFEPRDERYPNNELAAHVLGFTGDDGRGLAGMEKEMDKWLSGAPGERWVEQDAKRKEIAGYQTRTIPAVDGYNVTLTINMAIQHVVEDELDQIVQNDQPNGACIVVMDPHTGAILGMGSRPTYDPNDRRTFTADAVRNRCITDMVEPGSIFKIITLAAALNEGAVTLQTPVYCENGSFLYGGKILRDDEPNGWLSVEEVLAKSSNIGCAKIALNYIHEENLYKYARAFGIGQRTGIMHDQDESPGLLRPLSKWSELSVTRIPMGQEVGATALQMATAMSVIANGGNLVEPRLALKVTDAAGRTVRIFQPRVVRQVISSDAAADVARALEQVTVDGTAKNIRVPGYSIACKTGTAQKFVDGAYSHTKFVSSFIGFMPVENPAFVALVMVDEPHTAKYYGAEVSGPVFAAMAEQLTQIMNIPADRPLPTPGPVLSANTSSNL